MGKVYDALRRAEEQRARRAEEAASAVVPAVPSAPQAAQDVAQFDGSRAPRHGERPSARPASLDGGEAHNKRRIALLQPESVVAEQFRSLRSRLDAIAETRPLRTIAVTSALSGDGKTTAAISLAVVSAMHLGRRVVLVECDLRNATIAAALGLRVDAGLAEVLADGAPLEQAILRADGTALDVLAARGLPQNPSELLASEKMRKLVESLASRYDRVVLDLPPALGLPDAKIVSGLCDGTVFVVRADVTRRPEIEMALEVLGRDRVVGLVMNGAEQSAYPYKYEPRI